STAASNLGRSALAKLGLFGQYAGRRSSGSNRQRLCGSVAWTQPGIPELTMMERRRPRNVPSRALVLVADDYPDTRDMYVTTLAAFGFEAVPVSQCADMFRRAWERHPDAIVADLPVLGAGGGQLIQHSNQAARTPDIPIVLLSGH